MRELAAGASAAIVDGRAVADPDYREDARAEADANFAFAAGGGLIEAQLTAEDAPLPAARLGELAELARTAAAAACLAQQRALAHATGGAAGGAGPQAGS